MKFFVTRVWGFHPKSWPVVAFGKDGDRDNLVRKSRPGDAIIFVGTRGEPTSEPDRGRLLGIMKFGRRLINTWDVLQDVANGEYTGPEFQDSKGNFKWRHSLLMMEAWSFTNKPLLTSVFQRQLPRNATTQAVELKSMDIQAIKALSREQIQLPNTPKFIELQQQEIAPFQGKPIWDEVF